MPDESWKGQRDAAPYTHKGGETSKHDLGRGFPPQEYTYKNTGGTGKFEGASGGEHLHTLEELTKEKETLMGTADTKGQ